MTETIAPAVPSARVAGDVDIRIEDDASPIVRLIGRALRDSVRAGHALSALRGTNAVAALRSHDTPQAATLAFADGVITVSSGVFVEPDVTLTVDLNARFALAGEPAGAADLATAVLDALNPPVPDWREAAKGFWTAVRSVRGIPDVLIAVAADESGGVEPLVLGEGDTQYLIAGPPEVLAGIFSGADDLLAVLSSGVIGLRGTMSHLSVMAGASWKVRYDV
ncbi:hypothetical protein SAMN04244553_6527 [Nocardia amikacinitolerans]|uniref:Uncharacterized protein n=1 Tax=Nocardia amikacinitolerans TaxID=756689 RepID=A0A285LX79_9NOCA|nr:hypothetical protein [Nocardia amikacinitolerans]MCP2279603.1 hypothetical protein [Nocardia amikacinitolerans]MCP2298617.1 hypothetical protein [Nocardia amikacinitolerans]SNY89508.1 hypothetical protein SAMN04244553_6527 [Nocardia amikacinitolerans]